MSLINKCRQAGIDVFGTQDKTNVSTESAHMITFFSFLRREHPLLGMIAVHIRNEGKRSAAQARLHSIEGMVKGAADILIPGNPSFVCEMKSTSPKASISDEQIYYLDACKKQGAFTCVAIGHEGAKQAVRTYLEKHPL